MQLLSWVIKKRHHELFFLIFIFCIGLFLRVYKLNDFPVGLHGDEASIGYTAYSLLKTGRDQNGNFLPLAIDQFGDFRPAGYHYLDIPFIAVFGLLPFAVRLPAALFGSLTVLAFYFLLKQLLENKFVSLLGSLLLAILPWDINISRASSEGVIASFFVILGIYLFVKGIKRKKTSVSLLIFSFLLIIISFFFYHEHRYFIVLFFPLLILLSSLSYKFNRRKIAISAIFYACIFLVLIFFLTLGKGTGRVSEVSLLTIPGGTTQLKTAMDEEGTLNPLLTRFYDNKLYFYGRLFLTFYSEHLNGDFLFVNTGNPVRYKIPFTGNVYIIMAPFLLLGLAFAIAEGIKRKKYILLIPVVWLLLAPIPAALTWEDLPNVERASLMIYPLIILTCFGFYETMQLFKGNIRTAFIVVCTAILFQNFLYFYHNYFWRLKIHEPWNRSASEENLITTINALGPKYDGVVMTTEHNNNFIFYLFYNKYDPKKFQQMGSPKERDNLIFENITYTYSPCPLSASLQDLAIETKNMLYVEKENCHVPKNARVVDTMRTPDGIPAFILVDVPQKK